MPKTDLIDEMLYTRQDMIDFATLAVDECTSETEVSVLYHTMYEMPEEQL